MPVAMQHVLVLLIVAASVAVVAGQAVRTLRGKRSKLGACCAKGCDAGGTVMKSQLGGVSPSPPRVVFFPAEMLTTSRRRGSTKR
jgi:hypothetical protein